MARQTASGDSLPRRFGRLSTASVTDVLDALGLRRQTLPATLRPLAPDMRLAGYAFPVRGRAHRPRPREEPAVLRQFLTMLGAVPAGSVLVVAANDGVAAHFGELSAEWLRVRGARGAVIDGATRDVALLRRLRFPTFVRYRTPQDSVPRWRVSDWGQPVTIGGVRVALGDVVVGDADGVVSVPRRLAHEVLGRAERVAATEHRVRAAVRRGLAPLAAWEKFGRF